MEDKWFVIINPTSGNSAAKKSWQSIYSELVRQKFNFEFEFSKYNKHSIHIVKNVIKKGFKKIICVGGDGTLHNIVNGILSFNTSEISTIKIGVIPIGTGNDWVKTYKIPKDFKKTIKIIKAEKTIKQDIGKILIHKNSKEVYFNNLAGIGFDAYVVNKVNKYKKLGSLAYIVGGLVSLISYKKSNLEIRFDSIVLKNKCLMLLIGLCKFSGGGMQLTKNSNSRDGLFDISYIQKINLFTILYNIKGLFNGSITNTKLVKTYKTSTIKIKVLNSKKVYIQADGEIVGFGNFTVSMLPKAITFIIPE